MVKNHLGNLGFDVEKPKDIRRMLDTPEEKLNETIKWKFNKRMQKLNPEKMLFWTNLVDSCRSIKEIEAYSEKLKQELIESYNATNTSEKREKYFIQIAEITSFEKSKIDDIKQYLDNYYDN
jgi:hypothetical protein